MFTANIQLLAAQMQRLHQDVQQLKAQIHTPPIAQPTPVTSAPSLDSILNQVDMRVQRATLVEKQQRDELRKDVSLQALMQLQKHEQGIVKMIQESVSTLQAKMMAELANTRAEWETRLKDLQAVIQNLSVLHETDEETALDAEAEAEADADAEADAQADAEAEGTKEIEDEGVPSVSVPAKKKRSSKRRATPEGVTLNLL